MERKIFNSTKIKRVPLSIQIFFQWLMDMEEWSAATTWRNTFMTLYFSNFLLKIWLFLSLKKFTKTWMRKFWEKKLRGKKYILMVLAYALWWCWIHLSFSSTSGIAELLFPTEKERNTNKPLRITNQTICKKWTEFFKTMVSYINF